MRLGLVTRIVLVVAGLAAIVVAGVAAWRMRMPVATPLAVVGPPVPPPPPPWTMPQLRDLLAAIDDADAEGLRATDYDRAALSAAIDGERSGAATDAVARAAALRLAHDFANGRMRRPARFNWYIDRGGPDDATLRAQIETARAAGTLGAWLVGLLPADPHYLALRRALADAPEDERRDRIVANMERWRWLPRGFGAGDTLTVNLPSYRLEVRHDGHVERSYDVVIGATDMPTPTLSASVQRVVVNPSWVVPASIVAKSHLRPGGRYAFATLPSGRVRVTQKPGPGNALGKVKIDFPNRLAIYFHDTPSRSLFARDERAFSHGCVRVRDIDALAAFLLGGDPRFAAAYAGSDTRSLAVKHPWRADIVYFTLVPDADGGLHFVGDPYRMDATLAAALVGRRLVVAPAAKPPVAKRVTAKPADTAPDPRPAIVLPPSPSPAIDEQEAAVSNTAG